MSDENMSYAEAKILAAQARVMALQEELATVEARHLEATRLLGEQANKLVRVQTALDEERRVSQAYRDLISELFSRIVR